MNKCGVFSVALVGTLFVGTLVCFPVFAENPVNISIVEVVDDGNGGYKPWEDITGAMPGMTYSAIPRVRNDGLVAVMVRMCLSESATNGAGETIELPANTFGININSNWTIDNDVDGDASDPASGNCYRYNSEVAVGGVTEPIFTEVALSPTLGNEYQGATFNLHLVADAIGDAPDESGDDGGVPANPDTGSNSNSEPLTRAWYISLSVGLVAFIGLIIYLLSKAVRKK